MVRDGLRLGLAAAAVVAVAGCDRLALGPGQAASAPTPVAEEPFDGAALREHAGETYSSFVAVSGGDYAPDALGIVATDRVRLWRGMAQPQAGKLVTGGGAEALVFRGCSDQGCDYGSSVVAVDTTTGGVFAATRDVGGADVLAPNDRVEALLRLNSPTRSWYDPAPETAQP